MALIEYKNTLYHNINKPLYLQLRDIIIDWIDSKELEPGDALPSERALVDMFDISRVTVRKCLDSLEADGYLIRQHGKDTRVAERRVIHHLGLLVGIVEELQQTPGVHIEIEVVYKRFEAASGVVRRQLSIPENKHAPVYAFSRVLKKNGVPLALNYSYVPYDIGKIVDTLDLNRAHVFEYLESIGYKLNYGEQVIRAGLCNADESGLLSYSLNQPVIVIARTSYLEGDIPLMYEKTIYRGDEYQYRIRLKRRI
ncbi:MAG TPA: GntR family transcriptional regulator [Clostridia bacterium]|nr:GntR family transcriptional regulator [Clostridia bacterium]